MTVGVWGFLSAVVALIFDIEKLVEFMSIGTLMAYSIVSAAVVILRYRPKHKIDTIPLTEINSEQVQEVHQKSFIFLKNPSESARNPSKSARNPSESVRNPSESFRNC